MRKPILRDIDESQKEQIVRTTFSTSIPGQGEEVDGEVGEHSHARVS